jgi:hypothetical protein
LKIIIVQIRLGIEKVLEVWEFLYYSNNDSLILAFKLKGILNDLGWIIQEHKIKRSKIFSGNL